MSKEQPVGNYQVGRGKPPKHSRFKPGQSGNPRGRPKGAINFDTALMEAANVMVVVNENGRQRKRRKIDIAIAQMVNKAAKGDSRAAELLFRQIQRTQSEPSTTVPPSHDDGAEYGTPDDDEAFAALMSRLKARD